MDIIDWIPSLVTSGGLGVVAVLSKNLIVTRLTNSVKHEYDVKLEAIKANHKESEQRFQAELQKRDLQVEAIRDSALSGLAHQKSLLFEKQLDAVDNLWKSFVALSPAKVVSTMMSRINIDEVSKTIARDTNLQEFFKMIGQNVDLETLGGVNSTSLRPFVSEPIWAYFSAYQSIVLHYVVLAKMFELGLDKKMTKSEELVKLVSKVLPHQKEFIEKYEITGAFYLLEEIEQLLLSEIQNFLSGKGISEERLKEATEIIKYSEQLKVTDESK
ncbi:hypothetical protein [Vibrio parahaemolyticus]|uniref:hypothetical protein n=1 Tax=Vibrio parahaemolyticus TaxID=670 RepID=UPI00111E2C47|nr:hypothetical protein [Vibrio parahaemolyticus]TOE34300.1 hypothetical protein CGJ46_03625 [Vibrio parahaemolyticus]